MAGNSVLLQAVQPEAASVPEPGARLVSLDVFRGFTMFWLIGGKGLLLALAALGGAALEIIRYELTHSPWEGVRYYDLIWPSFMLMVGVSIPFSFAHRSLIETCGRIMRRVWKRAAVLFLLGSLRESIAAGAPLLVELSSALQPIALAYVVASYLAGRSVRLQASVGALILAGYALLLAFVPATGIPAGSYEKNHNLVTAADWMIVGRAHPEGWGTVLSAIPAISTTILGLIFSQVLRSNRPAEAKMKVIGLAGLGCLACGFAISPVVPVIMKLWTTSYALISAGWASLLFLFFYWLADVRGYRKWSFPLVVIGTNAIAAYLLPTIIPVHRLVSIFAKPIAQAIGPLGPLFSSGAILLVSWSVLFWMYKRRILLKA